MLTTSNDLLRTRIDAFVAHADAVTAKYFADNKYTHSRPPIHRADYISDKWCRIVTLEDRGGDYHVASIYGFVALVDNYTRSLGNVVAGDIHKSAGFKAPAKTARGSVFAEDFGNAATPFGIAYLR